MLCIPIPLTPQGSRLLRPTRHMRAERNGWPLPSAARVSVMTAAWRTAVSRPNPDGVSSSRSRTSSNRGRDKSCHRCVRAGESNSRLVRARSARASSRLAPRGARQPRLRRTPIRLTGGVVERLCGQRLRLPDARSFRFGGIETACRSHQRIKATPVCPRAFVAVGGRARLGRCRAESVPHPAGQSRTRRGDVAAPDST